MMSSYKSKVVCSFQQDNTFQDDTLGYEIAPEGSITSPVVL